MYKINSAKTPKSSDEFVKLRFLNSKIGAMATVDTGAKVSILPARVYKQLYPKSVDGNGEIQGVVSLAEIITNLSYHIIHANLVHKRLFSKLDGIFPLTMICLM